MPLLSRVELDYPFQGVIERHVSSGFFVDWEYSLTRPFRHPSFSETPIYVITT